MVKSCMLVFSLCLSKAKKDMTRLHLYWDTNLLPQRADCLSRAMATTNSTTFSSVIGSKWKLLFPGGPKNSRFCGMARVKFTRTSFPSLELSGITPSRMAELSVLVATSILAPSEHSSSPIFCIGVFTPRIHPKASLPTFPWHFVFMLPLVFSPNGGKIWSRK